MASKADRARKGSRAGVAGWLTLTVLAAASGVALVPAAVLGAGPAQAASAGGPAARGSQAAPAGDISTVAGGVGGPAKATKVAMGALGVASAGGSIYVAGVTQSGGTVRKVSPAGELTTPVGTGVPGPPGDGGLASKASLGGADGVAVDHSGNPAIADTYGSRLRLVAAHTGTFFGQLMTARHIYTVASGIHQFSAVAVDGAGNLVVADQGASHVDVVAARAGTFYGQKMKAGHLYTVAGNGNKGYSGDGGPATSAELDFPQGVAVDGAGNVLIADRLNNRIRVVTVGTGTFYGQKMKAGDIYTVAGTGGEGYSGDGVPATHAELNGPPGVAVDAAGNLVIADNSNERVRVVAARAGTFYGQAMKAGFIYTVAGGGTLGDGHRATSAQLLNPAGVAVDGSGNLLIADTVRSRIRVVAAHTGTFYGQAMKANFIYTVAGMAGQSGYTGDGIPATSAELNFPDDVTADGSGNLVIADTNNNRIRVVAAHTGTFYGQKMQAGDIYSVAGDGTPGFLGDGGPATLAELNAPQQVAVDGAGNLVIADTGNNRIRIAAATTGTFYGRAMTAGRIYTVAGNGKPGFAGDGGPCVSAELNAPEGMAIDGSGLVIADSLSSRIRMVAG
jgi:NHL repeat